MNKTDKKIGFFIRLNETNKNEIRHMQVGLKTEKFTGLIYGYSGGGEYEQTWMVEGKTIEEIGMDAGDEPDFMDGDYIEGYFIELIGKRIYNSINKKMDELTTYDEEQFQYLISRKVKTYIEDELKDIAVEDKMVISEGGVKGVTYGNTIFD